MYVIKWDGNMKPFVIALNKYKLYNFKCPGCHQGMRWLKQATLKTVTNVWQLAMSKL